MSIVESMPAVEIAVEVAHAARALRVPGVGTGARRDELVSGEIVEGLDSRTGGDLRSCLVPEDHRVAPP